MFNQQGRNLTLMSFESINDRLARKMESILGSEKETRPPRPTPPPPSKPSILALSDVPAKPVTWLWPDRIPLGHLTLLDAAPGCDPSLFALTLAACVSSGLSLPGGAPIQKGTVILLIPYDSPSNIIKPRLEAAGGYSSWVMLFRLFVERLTSDNKDIRTRSLDLSRDLEYLAAAIRTLLVRLVIFDPASAVPGLSRYLPTLIEIAHQANCAILLTRSLRQQPADPFSPAPASPLLEAASTRLLLTPDPVDERHHLLLATRHLLSSPPPVLAYHIRPSEAGIPTIRWIGERDSSHLVRLSTGPLLSPQRQAILRFLRNSASPRSHEEILAAASYDRDAGRKMIYRMRVAGELVSLARGLYTTPNHPCLAQFNADNTTPVPNVPIVSGQSTSTSVATTPLDNPVPNVPNSPSSPSPANDNSASDVIPPAPNALTTSIPTPATNEAPQQQPDTSL
jgi:hypothetical protein